MSQDCQCGDDEDACPPGTHAVGAVLTSRGLLTDSPAAQPVHLTPPHPIPHTHPPSHTHPCHVMQAFLSGGCSSGTAPTGIGT